MASPELWQRVYAIENQKHFKRSLSFFHPVLHYNWIYSAYDRTGDQGSNIPGIEADNTLIVGFSRLLPVGLAGLSVVIIYSSVSSSADTYMFTTASFSHSGFLEKTGLTKKENLRKTMRYSMVVLMILGIGMALS